MSKGFTPFSASTPGLAPSNPGSRAKVVADSKLAGTFRSINESGVAARTSLPAVHEPKVTLERDGTRVTRIKVQCMCGHTIELDCE